MKKYTKGELTAWVGWGKAQLSYGTVTNPTEDILINDGYEYSGTGYPDKLYAERVTYYIRKKYTSDDEFALINNYLLDPEAYKEAYAAYQEFRKECKEKAKKDLGIE